MRQVFLWCCALAVAASLLVVTHYRSRDPDSLLYARLSTELAQEPPSRWIAPEWRGAWHQQGLFREHPVGILLPSVLAIRAGIPAAQAAYIVNMLYQVAVIALIPLVAGALVRGFEARTLAWALQLLPVAFVYRIRGNQEHPLLMCFLAVIYGTHRARTQPAWIALTVAAFCFLVLIKGAFAMFTLVAAVLWLLIVRSPGGASDRWAWAGLLLAAIASALMMAGYEAIYVRTTGESFLDFYRSTRLGQSVQFADPRVIPHALVNAGWYLLRLAWFAAPWSLIAFTAVGVWLLARVQGGARQRFEIASAQGIQWVVLTTAVFIVVLSPALVRAERFIFPAYFAVGAVGVVAAIRTFGPVRRLALRADQHAWLPIATWLVTFLLSLGSKVLR